MIKKVLTIFFILYLSSAYSYESSNYSVMMKDNKVSVEHGLKEWFYDFKDFVEADYSRVKATECAEVKELSGAILCNSYSSNTMNMMLARASIFVEGLFNQPKGTILPMDHPILKIATQYIGGHDLKSDDLKRFFSTMKKNCTNNQKLCLNKAETKLFDFLTAELKFDEPFVLITFSTKGNEDYIEVVGHEILHAQYFLDKKYSSAIDSFWYSLSYREKRSIRKTLSDVYDPTDRQLMRNEFQAYILQPNAIHAKLAQFVNMYQDRLLDTLFMSKVYPLQVDE